MPPLFYEGGPSFTLTAHRSCSEQVPESDRFPSSVSSGRQTSRARQRSLPTRQGNGQHARAGDAPGSRKHGAISRDPGTLRGGSGRLTQKREPQKASIGQVQGAAQPPSPAQPGDCLLLLQLLYSQLAPCPPSLPFRHAKADVQTGRWAEKGLSRRHRGRAGAIRHLLHDLTRFCVNISNGAHSRWE